MRVLFSSRSALQFDGGFGGQRDSALLPLPRPLPRSPVVRSIYLIFFSCRRRRAPSSRGHDTSSAANAEPNVLQEGERAPFSALQSTQKVMFCPHSLSPLLFLSSQLRSFLTLALRRRRQSSFDASLRPPPRPQVSVHYRM